MLCYAVTGRVTEAEVSSDTEEEDGKTVLRPIFQIENNNLLSMVPGARYWSWQNNGWTMTGTMLISWINTESRAQQ